MQNEIVLNADNVFLIIEYTRIFTQNQKVSTKNDFNYLIILTTFFINLVQKKKKKQKEIEMFLISII